jgi:membrane associated rhomboid family serine protease
LHVRLVSVRLVSVCPTSASKAGELSIRYNRAVTEEPEPSASVRDRLISALADPEVAGKAGRNVAALVALHEPVAVFEWLGSGKGMVLLDHRGVANQDLGTHLDRIVNAHERGLLFVTVAGGDASVAEALKAADHRARNRDELGLYHVDDQGRARRVAGRRLPELEKAARNLPVMRPLSPADIDGIVERGRKERIEATEFVRGTTRRFPHLTLAIIVLCVLFFAVTTGGDARARHLYELLSNRPDAVRDGELWRLFTYAFLHDRRNSTHLIVNMLSVYSVASFLEPLLGRFRLGLLYGVSALAGGIASTLLTDGPSVGASGAVWGLMGATLGLLQGKHRFFPALIARGLRQRLVVILAINVVISFLPGIDRWCHFGGGVAGYVLGRLFAQWPRKQAGTGQAQ